MGGRFVHAKLCQHEIAYLQTCTTINNQSRHFYINNRHKDQHQVLHEKSHQQERHESRTKSCASLHSKFSSTVLSSAPALWAAHETRSSILSWTKLVRSFTVAVSPVSNHFTSGWPETARVQMQRKYFMPHFISSSISVDTEGTSNILISEFSCNLSM